MTRKYSKRNSLTLAQKKEIQYTVLYFYIDSGRKKTQSVLNLFLVYFLNFRSLVRDKPQSLKNKAFFKTFQFDLRESHGLLIEKVREMKVTYCLFFCENRLTVANSLGCKFT
jgi:hypothetical protein